MSASSLSLISGALVVLASPVALADERAASAPSIALYAAAGPGSVLDTPKGAVVSAQGSLRLNLPLARLATLELMGSGGYAFGRAEPDDAWLRLALGLRIEDALAEIRPYGAFRLVHIHFASAETWSEHPLDSLAGSSTEGLQHRSGMSLATGISLPIAGTQGKLRGMAELELSWIPIGNPPAWFMGTEFGFGYVF
jgi:hypothetical protein